MLKVTTQREPGLTRLVIEGRLVQAGVAELNAAWLHAQATDPGATIEVELSDVTYLDQRAMQLLVAMRRQAVRLSGSGTMTRALIQQVADAARLCEADEQEQKR